MIPGAGNDRAVRGALLRLVRDIPGTTRIELAETLGLSTSTVSRIVTRLVNDGLVLEGDSIERSAVGRRPTALLFNGRAFHLAGVEINGTQLTAALASLDGELQHQRTWTLPPHGGPGALDVLRTAVAAVIAAAEADGLSVRGIGIGAPGVTDFAHGQVVWAPSLSWRNLGLRDTIQGHFGVPTFVENDTNLAALGEHWLGAGRGAASMAYLHVSEGIGAGVIIAGELVRGHHHTAGEVGHVLPSRQAVAGSFEQEGAMESVTSSQRLGRRYDELAEAAAVGAFASQRPLTPDGVLTLARAGDGPAEELAAELLDHVAMMVVALMATLDPEVLVLGGDLANHGPWGMDQIRDRVRRVLPAVGDIRLSALGPAAGVVGASALALVELENLHPRPKVRASAYA